jgi:hypothetical protein
MHVHWLLPQQNAASQFLLQSTMASVRLRAGALAYALRGSSHTLTAGEVLAATADVCVIGKVGGHETQRRHQAWVQQLRSFPGQIVLDFTDDHLTQATVMSAFYGDCLRLAHRVVCSSRWLQTVVAQRFAGPVTVIEDAIDMPLVPPKSRVGDPLRLLWFGHATNMQGLIDFLPLLPQERPLEMIVVSNPPGLQMLHDCSLPAARMTVQPRVWSPAEMLRAAQDSDICLIPAGQGSTRKVGVSANRLLTALTLGLPTAADALPAYTEFSRYFADLRTPDLQALLDAPLQAVPRVQAFQREVPARFSLKAMGQAWLDCLSGTV